MPVIFNQSGEPVTADSTNMLIVSKAGKACRCYIAKPFGPVFDGKYVFEEYIRVQLEGLGLHVHFIDSTDYHLSCGEIHCGTNQVPSRNAFNNKEWWKMKPLQGQGGPEVSERLRQAAQLETVDVTIRVTAFGGKDGKLRVDCIRMEGKSSIVRDARGREILDISFNPDRKPRLEVRDLKIEARKANVFKDLKIVAIKKLDPESWVSDFEDNECVYEIVAAPAEEKPDDVEGGIPPAPDMSDW